MGGAAGWWIVVTYTVQMVTECSTIGLYTKFHKCVFTLYSYLVFNYRYFGKMSMQMQCQLPGTIQTPETFMKKEEIEKHQKQQK